MIPAKIKIGIMIAKQTSKHWKKIVPVLICFIFLLFIGGIMVFEESESSNDSRFNEEVRVWAPIVEQIATEKGIPEYVDVILAIIMVESNGQGLDIMQSSESIGLPPNTITDPITSIYVGISHLASVINHGKNYGLDFWTPIQSYNYGLGFNNFILNNGRSYTFQLATAFSRDRSGGRSVPYSNPIANFNGNYRYAYGNMYYVLLVQQYLGSGDFGDPNASPLGAETYQALMSIATRFNGWPYAWGGNSPSVGFDCSGLTEYVYRQVGFNLPRTAAEQYNSTIRVADPQPGDLIFFKGTNSSRPPNAITHVGIYVDNQRMFDSNNSGIGYSYWNQGYWRNHFAGFGRIVR